MSTLPGYRAALLNEIDDRLVFVPHPTDPTLSLPLDDHQGEAMMEIAAALQHTKHEAFSIVHCCGSGKTVVEGNVLGASQNAKRKMEVNGDRKDIILTTERSLMFSVRGQLEALGLTDIGIWGNGEKTLDRPIILASIQAMQMNRKDLGKQIPLDRIDLVVGDEADNYLTEQRSKVVRGLNGALRVGFTATQRWRDGRDVSDLWGPKIHELMLAEGIREGINTPPIWKLYEAAMDAETIKIKKNDYDSKSLGAAMRQAEIHKAIPEIYRMAIEREQRRDFPTMIYVPNTDMVRQITETMQRQFGPEGLTVKGWVGENIGNEELRTDIQDFNARRLNVLVLCEMGGRGLDLPAARFMLDAYPTLSPTKLEQRHGRVLRRVREGTPLHQAGFQKPYSLIVQIHPKSNRFRPVCLPDILDGWKDAEAGLPLALGGKTDQIGAPALAEIAKLQKRLENQKPTINVSLVQQMDLYRKVNRWDDLPQADATGFFYLPKPNAAPAADTTGGTPDGGDGAGA